MMNDDDEFDVCPPERTNRPQRDDLLELERQLAKLGLESKTAGPRVRGRHHRLVDGNPPHLSSALGDSFFFLNKSVIFGGAGTAAAAPVAGTGGFSGAGLDGAGVSRNGGVAGLPPTAATSTDTATATRAGAAGAAATPSGGGPGRPSPSQRSAAGVHDDRRAGAPMPTESGVSNSAAPIAAAGRREARGGLAAGGEPREARRSDGTRHSPAGQAVAVGGVGRGRRGSWGGEGTLDVDVRPLSAAEEDRRVKEEETQQAEIMRLLKCLKTLGDENVSLMKECEDRDKASPVDFVSFWSAFGVQRSLSVYGTAVGKSCPAPFFIAGAWAAPSPSPELWLFLRVRLLGGVGWGGVAAASSDRPSSWVFCLGAGVCCFAPCSQRY